MKYVQGMVIGICICVWGFVALWLLYPPSMASENQSALVIVEAPGLQLSPLPVLAVNK